MPQWPFVAALAAVVTLVFLVAATSSGRYRFAFRQESHSVTRETRADGEYLVVTIVGIIQNKSTKPNGLVQLTLVRWRRNRRGTTLLEPGPCELTEGVAGIALPLRFEGKHDRRVTLKWEIKTDGTTFTDGYEVALEDSNGQLYDQRGTLKNAKNIRRRQQLGQRGANVQDGKLISFLAFYFRIKVCDLGFLVRRTFWLVGL